MGLLIRRTLPSDAQQLFPLARELATSFPVEEEGFKTSFAEILKHDHLHLAVAEAFQKDSRYRALQQFYTPGVYNSGKETGFDGAEMTLFISREFAESLTPPEIKGRSVKETIDVLKKTLASPSVK